MITRSYYYAGSQRVAMRENDALFYLLGDHLGSTSLTLDANGNKVTEQRYKPWGEIRYSSGQQITDYEFTGQRSRRYIGLVQMGSRLYDPALGRFSQPDVLVPGAGLPAGFDRYMFVFSNPLIYVDPTGNTPDCWDDEYACGADPTIEYELETILDEIPFDETFGGNIPENVGTNTKHNLSDEKLLTTGERIGLATTGVVIIVGFTAAEISLGIMGIAALDLGPLGVVLDTGIIVPTELFLIDSEIAYARYVYDVVTTGTKEGKTVQLFLFSFLQSSD